MFGLLFLRPHLVMINDPVIIISLTFLFAGNILLLFYHSFHIY